MEALSIPHIPDVTTEFLQIFDLLSSFTWWFCKTFLHTVAEATNLCHIYVYRWDAGLIVDPDQRVEQKEPIGQIQVVDEHKACVKMFGFVVLKRTDKIITLSVSVQIKN